MRLGISIHALLAESDNTVVTKNTTAITISIHALLAESDPQRAYTLYGCIYFYPRSPCGERQVNPRCPKAAPNFYPRSPCGERPKANTALYRSMSDFYPRSPCGERQQKCTKQWGTFAHMKQILWRLHLHADRQGCI